ncbi:MAG: YnfA family protein [Pseudomonadota bacterium]|nr:YnfA family protein [Pseudomonadota bacterium]
MLLKTLALFTLTAISEIVGCWLVLTARQADRSWWLLVPAAASLALFAWLLTLHPAASGRVYAAYGGIYVATALLWLFAVDRIPLGRWDVLGGVLMLGGSLVIIAAHWRT